MRSLAATLLTAVLAGATASLSAAQLDERYLAQCKSEVSQRYGAGHEISLVSMRRSSKGVSLKMAVRLDSGLPDRERVEFTTCIVRREQLPGSVDTGVPGGSGSVDHPAAAPSR